MFEIWHAAKDKAIDRLDAAGSLNDAVSALRADPAEAPLPPPSAAAPAAASALAAPSARPAGAGGQPRKKRKALSLSISVEVPVAAAYQEQPRSTPLSQRGLDQLQSSTAEMDDADLSELTKGGLLGRGTSGRVYRGIWNGMRVAVKYFMVESAEAGEDDLVFKAFRTELELMRRMNHENLLRVYTSYMKPPIPFLVTELMAGSVDSFSGVARLPRSRSPPGSGFT